MAGLRHDHKAEPRVVIMFVIMDHCLVKDCAVEMDRCCTLSSPFRPLSDPFPTLFHGSS